MQDQDLNDQREGLFMAEQETPLQTSWLLLLRNLALAAGLGAGGYFMVQTSETVVVIIGACMLLSSPALLLMPLFMGLPRRGPRPECGGVIEAQAPRATDMLCRGCTTYLDAGDGKLRRSDPARIAAMPIYAAPTPWQDLNLIVFPTISFSAQDKIQDALTTKSAGTRVMDPCWPHGCCVCSGTPVRFDTVMRKVAKPGTIIDTEIALVLKDVPYCAQHKDGISFDRVSSDTPGAEDGFGLKFRSLAYRNEFMKINPWRFTWRDQPQVPPGTRDQPQAPLGMRDQSIAASKRGDELRDSGDLTGAKAYYEQSLSIDERLARDSPSSSLAQRDLSITYNKLGDAARDSGDLVRAKSFYEQSLDLRERQARSSPTNTQAQRDLSLSYERLGNIARDNGDLAGAMARYEHCVGFVERLARDKVANPSAERDLTVSYNKLGDVLRESGYNANAKIRYTQSLEIRQRLVRDNPSNTEAQRDLSLSYERLGELAVKAGDNTGAISWYRQSQTITRHLANTNPSNQSLQKDAKITDERLAELMAKK